MAEVLAAAASIAGLSSLAIQLAECAITLRRFYRNVKNGAETLEGLVFDIETLVLALKGIEQNSFTHAEDSNTELLHLCVQACEIGIKKIKAVAARMEQHLSKAKSIGRIYVAMKEHDVQIMTTDLERAKNTLSLAFQLYTESQRRRDSVRHILAISHLSTQVSAMPMELVFHLQHSDPGPHDNCASSPESTALADIPPSEVEADRTGHRDPYRTKRSGGSRSGSGFTFVIPSWFSNRVWRIAATRASCGWDFRVRTYTVRPRDSPIFQCITQGDLDGVRRLIANGEASPLDCQEEDLTAIVMRAAWSCWSNPWKEPPSMGLTEEGRVELFRTLLEKCDFDHMDYYSGHVSYTPDESLVSFSFEPCVDMFLASLPVPLRTLSFDTRFDCAMHMDNDEALPGEFLKICGLREITPALAASEIEVGWTALHFAAQAISFRWRNGKPLDGWPGVAKRLIELGANLHHTGPRQWATPLLAILCWNTYESMSLEVALELLRYWVTLVEGAGKDIVQYGAREASLCQEVRATQWEVMRLWSEYSICGIHYDAVPAQWSILLWPIGKVPLYRHIYVPGSWQDEHVPEFLCWQPDENEWASGTWRPWERKPKMITKDMNGDVNTLVLIGKIHNIETVIDKTQPSAFEIAVADTQDDHGILALLISRSRTTTGFGRRSSSAPPSLNGRSRAYHKPNRLTHHKPRSELRMYPRLDEYHLCPADGLHRFRCARKLAAVKDWSFFDGKLFTVADCLKTWSSLGVS